MKKVFQFIKFPFRFFKYLSFFGLKNINMINKNLTLGIKFYLIDKSSG